MKFRIVVAIVFAVSYAEQYDAFLNQELETPFKNIYAYMQCVPPQIDQLVYEYGCDSIWDEFRKSYIHTINSFEKCASFEKNTKTDNDSDE